MEAVLEAIADIVNAAKDPSCLEIDVTVVWMGNELCGRRGVFLDPGTPNWQIGPEGYAAEGLWPEIAGRVCGEIGPNPPQVKLGRLTPTICGCAQIDHTHILMCAYMYRCTYSQTDGLTDRSSDG